MATSRPFAYNTGTTISGTIQVGNLAVGTSSQDYSTNPGGVNWWMGPDEDLGFVIAKSVSGNTQSTSVSGVSASVGFERSTALTEASFIQLSNRITNQSFTGGTQASTWLTSNGYWNSYTTGPSGTLVTDPTFTNTTVVSSQSPFSGGGNAYSITGSTTSYLSVAGQDGFAFGTGDFTIEWFEYDRGSSSFPRIFWYASSAGTNTPFIGLSQEGSSASRANYVWTGGSPTSLGSTAITTNTWYHFALVRISGKIYLYKDGVIMNSGGTNYTSNFTNNTGTFYIGSKSGGGLSSEQFYGYITNFRVVKGLGVYTGNFTKPTSSLTITANANPFGGSNTVAIPDGYTKLLFVP